MDELKVQFKKALDEETVSEYRIMVTPGYGFSANEALLISPENYLSVLPTGNDIDIRLPKISLIISVMSYPYYRISKSLYFLFLNFLSVMNVPWLYQILHKLE